MQNLRSLLLPSQGSFIHESLSANPHSLLNLKRRVPTNKRTQSESDLGNATVVSATSTAYTAPAACTRPWSNNTIKKSPKSKGKSTKSKVKKEGGIQSKLSNVKGKKNASWNHALNTLQQSIPQGVNGPLRMPLIRHVPGQVSWSKSSSTSLLPKKLIPVKKTGLASIDLPDATNDTILEAQKLLEQNFRKTIQQEQTRPLQHEPPPQEQQSGPSYPQQQQAQQPPPGSMLTSNVQQSQQLIKLLQNHASALQMNDNGKVLWHQFNIQQQQQQPAFAPAPNNPNCMNMGQVEKFSFPPQANNTDTIMPAFSPNFAAKNNSDPQAVDNNFFGNFPSKSPDLLLNNSSHNNFGIDVDAANAANTMSTNCLMTASSDPPIANQNMMQQAPTRTTFPTTTNTTSNVSPPQGMMNTPPPNQIQQQLDDLLNNLLSTALPPSDELFDDDMSAGDVSEFGDLVGEGLQVSDDGGMLGLEP